MRILSALILCLFGMSGFAQVTANTESLHSLLVNGGYTRGGLSMGGDYEYAFHRTYGLGGYLRIYPEESSTGRSAISTFGGFVRPHFTRQSWDLFISPGLGLVQEEVAGKDKNFLGPILMWGLLFQFTNNMAAGFEETSIWGWFGDEKTWGLRSDEFLAKFRYSFN